jgi:hypothetical protein
LIESGKIFKQNARGGCARMQGEGRVRSRGRSWTTSFFSMNRAIKSIDPTYLTVQRSMLRPETSKGETSPAAETRKETQ